MHDKAKVRERVQAEASGAGGRPGPPKVTSTFIDDCLQANNLGDGMLYAHLHQGRYLYAKASQQWYVWQGHHWDLDVMDYSLADVEAVCTAYTNEAMTLSERIANADKEKAKSLRAKQDRIYKRIWHLRGSECRRKCREFAHSNPTNAIAVNGAEFDTNPWVFACKNGVINLRTGKIRPGRPDDYITKASPVEYIDCEQPAPTWERFLQETHKGDDPLVAYIRRLFGYGMTGLTIEHVMPILWGQGRNGKGTMVETISHVMGPMAAPIQSEMLLDQGFRQKGSTGPSPDIMALKGLRLAFASESDEGRRISPSRVKWLTGGDTLVGRNPYDRYEIQFEPSHLLMLITNERPNAPADDFAFWERAHLIPFLLSFVDREPKGENERPADRDLKQKLWAEAPGILAWLVRGCLEWQAEGLTPPPVVREATADYRREEDIIADFIDECCILDARAEIGAAKLYNAFTEWWKENVSNRVLSQKKFGRMMTKRFRREKRSTYIYYGLDLLERFE